ncbi:MAG: hypothetical protein ACO29Y_06355, partial [Holophagaceae bacterium]
EETTKGDKIGGQSGGAAVRSIPGDLPSQEDNMPAPPPPAKSMAPIRDTAPKNTVTTAPQYGFTSERTPEIRSSMLQKMKARYKR